VPEHVSSQSAGTAIAAVPFALVKPHRAAGDDIMGGYQVPGHGSGDDGFDEDGYDESQRAEILEATRSGPGDGTIQTDLDPDIEDDSDDSDELDDIEMTDDAETDDEEVRAEADDDIDEDDVQDEFDDGSVDDDELDDDDDAALKP
jgi:hypothetical protein